MKRHITRRTFMKGAAAGLTIAAVARQSLGANDKLNHACIGVGGMGWNDLHEFKSHLRTQVVAICDVDRDRLEKAAKFVPDARKYTDWRELLAKEGDKIDSVNVTVPDHTHAAATMTALAAKKHVYCQKPLCHDVYECRMIAEAAKKAGVVTQLGTQIASSAGDRMAVQMLRDGVIGKVKRAYLCSNRPGAESYRLVGPRPEKGQEPPKQLEWDLWLGTAPVRPYAPGYHPTVWRAWQDFGTGWSGDIGCHIFDAVWKDLGLTAPKSVIAEVQKSWKDSPARRGDTWPQGDHITWVFPGNDKTDGDITLEWFDGEFYPPEEAQALAKPHFKSYPAESSMVIGTKGALLLPHQAAPWLLPKENFKDYKMPRIPGRNHYHHFCDACLGGEMTESHFMQTGPMAEAIILGTVAIRCPDEKLQWDAPNLKITDNKAGQKLLKRTYRAGWEVAGL